MPGRGCTSSLIFWQAEPAYINSTEVQPQPNVILHNLTLRSSPKVKFGSMGYNFLPAFSLFVLNLQRKIRIRPDRLYADIPLNMNTKSTPAAKLSGTSFARLYRIVCVCFFIPMYIGLAAQNQDPAKPQILVDLAKDAKDGSGRIELSQPAQVESLLKLHIANNKLQKGIPGYQIRIFSLSGQTARQKATDVRASFMRSFPEMDARMEYNNPNFQILVGNFRTYTEAYYEKKKIEKVFPSAFIVSEIIEIPK